MSTLIQLGLSHLQPEAAAGSVDAQDWLDRFTTADEWLKKVFEGIEKFPKKDFKDAGRILGKLAGKTHEVITGVALLEPSVGRVTVQSASSKVTLRALSKAEIEIYLSTNNPLDKAGAEFNLAQAYYASGQRDKAEESVLAALEAAPGYRPAQKLLLEIEHPEQKDSPKTN